MWWLSGQSPSELIRVSVPGRRKQCGLAGLGSGARMGARQHRGVRRRRRQRDPLRAVRRRREDGDTESHAAAKGLFHRAIIHSTLADTAVRALPQEEASQAAELLLARVGRDQLRTLSAEQLLAAATSGPDLSLRFTPVVDGHTLPRHPYDPAAPQVSADIPLMLGSVETEAVPYQFTAKGQPDPYWSTDDLDNAELARSRETGAESGRRCRRSCPSRSTAKAVPRRRTWTCG